MFKTSSDQFIENCCATRNNPRFRDDAKPTTHETWLYARQLARAGKYRRLNYSSRTWRSGDISLQAGQVINDSGFTTNIKDSGRIPLCLRPIHTERVYVRLYTRVDARLRA